MIRGIEKLTQEQKDLMFMVNEKHKKVVGIEYKEGMEIIRAWIDKDGIVCVRLKNGKWFHYLGNHTWY